MKHGAQPRPRGHRRRIAGILATTLLLASAAAQAQTRFTSLTAFGDSYMDHGINLVPLLFGNTSNYPSRGGSVAALQAANPNGYVAYPYHVQALLGLADWQVTNYAIAGATTTPINAGGTPLSMPTEMAAWGGRPFGPRDLVLINIGGNDALGGARLGLNPLLFGAQVGSNAAGYVGQFVAAGARNVVFTGFSNMSFLPVVRAAGPAAVGYTDLFGASYYATLQAQMLPYALAGTRIFLMDQALLGSRISANPGAYGFDSIAYAGPGRVSMFMPDGLHLSSAGYAMASRYIANIVEAPQTHAAQGDAAQITTTAFARSIFGQLDGARTFAPVAGPYANPLSVHVAVTGGTGSRDSHPDALGLRYDAIGGQIGAEYRLDPSLKVGALFNYTSGRFDLRQNGGRIEQDAYQFGFYASHQLGPWFTDAMAIYGRGDLKIDRAGVIDTVRASTNSDSFAVGAKTAYLFDVSPWLQAGPLAGLTYVNSQVRGYTENGDPVLTYAVGRQTVEGLIGSAGAQVRFPFALGGQSLSPYVNVTAEHDFLGERRTLLATLTQSPLLPIATPVAGRGGSTYGAVQAGISAPITARTSIAINVATTFARRDGDDFGGNLVLRHSF